MYVLYTHGMTQWSTECREHAAADSVYLTWHSTTCAHASPSWQLSVTILLSYQLFRSYLVSCFFRGESIRCIVFSIYCRTVRRRRTTTVAVRWDTYWLSVLCIIYLPWFVICTKCILGVSYLCILKITSKHTNL